LQWIDFGFDKNHTVLASFGDRSEEDSLDQVALNRVFDVLFGQNNGGFLDLKGDTKNHSVRECFLVTDKLV
jgi:hypothetical protein